MARALLYYEEDTIAKNISVTIELNEVETKAVDYLIRVGIYGATRADVILRTLDAKLIELVPKSNRSD